MVIGRINPNETKWLILYGNIQNAQPTKTRAHGAFKDMLNSQEQLRDLP